MANVKKKVAVIGGGAAGMMAAICASHAGADVELYERNSRVGKKLLATGNGKCNFSNMNMEKSAYYGSAAVFYENMFSVFGVNETIDFFGQCGMLVKNKNGYLYPRSEQASTVLDILRFGLEQNSVAVHTDTYIEGIYIEETPIKEVSIKEVSIKEVSIKEVPIKEVPINEIHAGQGNSKLGLSIKGGAHTADKRLLYDSVIIACGGMAAPKTGSDGNGFKIAKRLGHHVSETVPALVQLRCAEQFFKGVAGVRIDAGLTLYINGKKAAYERGELQLTDYGISGIPVFQFSRQAAYALLHKGNVTVDIDFLPDYMDAEYRKFWEERWERGAHQSLEQFLTGISNKKINQLIIKLSGSMPNGSIDGIPSGIRRRIEELYRKLTVTVCATNGFESAQVCAGGILADELTGNLESKLVPNLYFAGEIIDMDGICGGYNLQWAWTSGAVAGSAAAGVALPC